MTSDLGVAGGLGLVLLGVILYLLNSNRQDRAQYRADVAILRKSIEDSDTRADKRIEAADQRSRQQIEQLDRRIAELERQVADERSLRLKAQSDAATAELRATDAEIRLARIRGD